ncbi:MAG: trypsin-like peptidase domain-containing protein [Ilumatobacteraceae bacterium]
MFREDDLSTPPQNPWKSPSWGAPVGTTPARDIAVPGSATVIEPPRPSRVGRRRMALAAVAVVTIAAGTVGGAIAGRNSRPAAVAPATSSANTGGFDTTSVNPANPAKADVSALISTALPGVVSISVVLSGGQAAGTGFVISSDGQIATNAHVVADATKIEVEFSDGSTAAAKVLGVDRTDDLAVIKVDKTGLKALPLGKSADLRIGEPVVAIGNALALTGGPTATEGIVSAVDRTIDTSDGEHLTHLVQTDAAINPGNSGGPLLTLDGEVVGINSAGSQNAQNIGFAIAIDTAQPIIEQLQQGKTVTKAYLGVSTTVVDATVAAQSGLDVDHGLLVADVAGNSAAETAGIQPGDVIVSINGKATGDNTVLGDEIRTAGAGKVVHLKIDRKGKTIDVDATLSTHAA